MSGKSYSTETTRSILLIEGHRPATELSPYEVMLKRAFREGGFFLKRIVYSDAWQKGLETVRACKGDTPLLIVANVERHALAPVLPVIRLCKLASEVPGISDQISTCLKVRKQCPSLGVPILLLSDFDVPNNCGTNGVGLTIASDEFSKWWQSVSKPVSHMVGLMFVV